MELPVLLIPALAVIFGLILLVWSADRFVDGAAATAFRLGMSPLLVGMVIVGFGTSAPELLVSALASRQGNPGLALGNAIGSNIGNLALILGITATVVPITVHSKLVRRELPILGLVTLLLYILLKDAHLSFWDGVVLLIAFVAVMAVSAVFSKEQEDPFEQEVINAVAGEGAKSLRMSVFWLVFGLVMLIASSRMLVWGAVEIALSLGVSDLVVGLTVVAVGTSLPELASTLVACRKGEHDLALGNIVGSNLFNTLAVIGLAAVIHPLEVEASVFVRDFPVMSFLTFVLFLTCIGFGGKQGRIQRWEGVLLLLAYFAYTLWVVRDAIILSVPV
jgi:cation:H+ antiporter